MDEIKFKEFKPIVPNSDLNRSQIVAYYQDNMLRASNEYMDRLLGTSENTTSLQSPSIKSSSSDNIRDILDNVTFSLPQTTPEVAQPVIPSAASKTVAKKESEAPITPIASGKVPKTKKDFIKMYGPAARKAAQATGLSEDMMLGQIALETGWGKHAPGYNVGGIKADKSWKGKSRRSVTKEQGEKGLYTTVQPFRVYNSAEEGFQGYVNFLKTNSRYKPLFGVSDPYRASEIMGKTGYATDANYTSKLKNMIREVQRVKSSI